MVSLRNSQGAKRRGLRRRRPPTAGSRRCRSVLACVLTIGCSGGSHAPDGGSADEGLLDSSELDASAVDAAAPTYAPTFTAIYGEILQPTCAGLFCHGGADDAFLPMETREMAYAAMVNVVSHGPKCGATGLELVDPGDPDASLVYLKVTSPPCGNRMPAEDEPYLDARQIDQIAQWIAKGALDDQPEL